MLYHNTKYVRFSLQSTHYWKSYAHFSAYFLRNYRFPKNNFKKDFTECVLFGMQVYNINTLVKFDFLCNQLIDLNDFL